MSIKVESDSAAVDAAREAAEAAEAQAAKEAAESQQVVDDMTQKVLDAASELGIDMTLPENAELLAGAQEAMAQGPEAFEQWAKEAAAGLDADAAADTAKTLGVICICAAAAGAVLTEGAAAPFCATAAAFGAFLLAGGVVTDAAIHWDMYEAGNYSGFAQEVFKFDTSFLGF